MGFADTIVLLGLWVLIVVDSHWVFEICWVSGQAFSFSFLRFFFFFLLRKSLFFNFFFFFSESKKGKRETFRVCLVGGVEKWEDEKLVRGWKSGRI